MVGSKARCISNTGGPGVLLTTASAHAATADVKVTITQADATGDGGPVARWTGATTTSTGYALDSFPNVINLYRHNGSDTGTLLGSGVANTTAANGILSIEVSGAGATVTVKSYVGGALKESVGDTSGSRLITANRTGVYTWTEGNVAQCDYDDFLAEDLGGGAAAVIQWSSMTMMGVQ